jgi:diguanylate cyclase (GGDEF)-like protein
MNDLNGWILAPLAALAGAAALALRRAHRRIDSERRRAEDSESKVGSCLTTIERLTRDREAPGPGEPGPAPPPQPSGGARYLFVSFEQEIERARRANRPLTLVTVDLAGSEDLEEGPMRLPSDRAMRRVAIALRGQLRGCDSCIRYAEDSFLLILPGVSRAEAEKVEARLRIAITGLRLTNASGQAVRARFHLGKATFPDEGADFDRLLVLADSRRGEERTPRSHRIDAGSPARFPAPDRSSSSN